MTGNLQRQTGEAAPNLMPARGGLLQRKKCACGNGGSSAGLSGQCDDCTRQKLTVQRRANGDGRATGTPSIVSQVVGSPASSLEVAAVPDRTASRFGHDFSQVKVYAGASPTMPRELTISEPGDALEREADRIAEQVLSAPSGTTPAAGAYVSGAGRGTLQAKELVGQPPSETVAGASLASSASSTLSGQPLPLPVKAFFEPRFGHDFSRVRVHTDARAAASARAVGAQAYTVGRDVVFGAGQYAPGTSAGNRLLAHELAHVVQQSRQPDAPPALLRKACGHDGKGTACGASAGRWKLIDESGPETITKWFSLDQIIVDLGIVPAFGGTWVTQVQTPPNPVKKGIDRGFVDGMKVSTAGVLKTEVVEIKGRSDEGGGCALATREADGYVVELKAIAPNVAAISNGLAATGGLRIPSDKRPNAAEKKILTAAGVNFDDPASNNAWLFYNSLQNRLNTTFTTGFSRMDVSTNADGVEGTPYNAGPPVIIKCPKRKSKGKNMVGLRQLKFMVNKKGGVSYGCEDRCEEQRDDEKEKEKEKELPKEEPKVRFEAVEERDDPYEGEPIHPPPGGIDEVDVIVYTTGALATVALLHEAAKRLKGKERKVAIEAAGKVTKEIYRRGAPQVAKSLNTVNLGKLGQKGYQQHLEKAATHIDDVAKKVPAGQLAKKLGPKAAKAFAKGGARLFIVIGIVMTAADAYAMADQISKGAELEIGFNLDDTELKGDTNVDIKGTEGKPKPDVSGDTKLTDTKIDIDVEGVPNISGTAEIEAKNVTITGTSWNDGDPVSINIKAKMQNTTLIIKHEGTIKGNGVVLDTQISDSVIEIDLPPGAVSQPPTADKPVTVKGVKMKVTSVSNGGGGGGKDGEGKGGGGKGEGKTGSKGADELGKGQGEGVPSTKSRQELLKEIKGDEKLLAVFERLLGEKGATATDEALRRFVALKPYLDRHEEALKESLEANEGTEVTDPIKQVIEPLEQLLLAEEAELQKHLEDAMSGKPSTPVDKPEAKAKTKTDATGTGEGTGKGSTDPTQTEFGDKGTSSAKKMREIQNVTAVNFGKISGQLTFPDIGLGKGSAEPLKKVNFMGVWTIMAGKSVLVYEIPLSLKLVKKITPSEKYVWQGMYEFNPPSNVILSTERDRPIQFTDKGPYQMKFGQKKKPSATESTATQPSTTTDAPATEPRKDE